MAPLHASRNMFSSLFLPHLRWKRAACFEYALPAASFDFTARSLPSHAGPTIAAFTIVLSSRRTGYVIDGTGWVMKTTHTSSTGSTQNAVDAMPPHAQHRQAGLQCAESLVITWKQGRRRADGVQGNVLERERRVRADESELGPVLAAGRDAVRVR
jgi:hypothetical protein